jgi:hypothetical protein
MRESMKFALGTWCNADKIKEEVNRIDPNTDFGDIYCRLVQHMTGETDYTKTMFSLLYGAPEFSALYNENGSVPITVQIVKTNTKLNIPLNKEKIQKLW